MLLPAPPPRLGPVGPKSKRYHTPRQPTLSPAHRDAARAAVARGRTLCVVAADFGVSHEPSRATIRRDGKPLDA